MKLKDRLVVSFLIILIVPLVLMIISGELFVSENSREIAAMLTNDRKTLFFNIFLAVFAILIITAFILISWTYGSIFPRMKDLEDAAKRIKEGDYDFRVNVRGNDELTDVLSAFEEMRGALSKSSKEKLEAEEEQRKLISNIAHDLKSPLTSIKGYAEGLRDGVAKTDEKRLSYENTIINKADEMNSLLNELTLYSKIGLSAIPYNFEKTSVREYFDNLSSDIALDLEKEGIEFIYRDFAKTDDKINIDREEIKRVVNNIITNSVKYIGDKNGKISLKIFTDGDFIKIEIKDNGIGISKKDLPYIFDRSFRADSSRNSKIKGSGFGLSIAKKIVEEHGGKIYAVSSAGYGTTMVFMLKKA